MKIKNGILIGQINNKNKKNRTFWVFFQFLAIFWNFLHHSTGWNEYTLSLFLVQTKRLRWLTSSNSEKLLNLEKKEINHIIYLFGPKTTETYLYLIIYCRMVEKILKSGRDTFEAVLVSANMSAKTFVWISVIQVPHMGNNTIQISHKNRRSYYIC